MNDSIENAKQRLRESDTIERAEERARGIPRMELVERARRRIANGFYDGRSWPMRRAVDKLIDEVLTT